MSTIYYSSIDNTRDGRASHFHRSAENAQAKVDEQNARAEAMGIKARYVLSETNDGDVESKDIRD